MGQPWYSATGTKVDEERESGLHDENDQSAVDDELHQFGRASVRVVPMNINVMDGA